MGTTVLPLSGVAYGQQLDFHGISQSEEFPVYVEPDYQDVLEEAGESHPYETVVATYDADVPGVAKFVDEVSSCLTKHSTLIRLPLKAGEQLKTPEQVARLVGHLGDAGISEKSIMLVIGGGTLCNLGGFIATMWSGMEPIFIPTNYTAIADVAVGSLHMINVGAQKNRLQIYHDPLAVVIDPRFIATLPKSERRSGLVETVKHGIAQDRALFEHLERLSEEGSIFDDINVLDLALRTAQLKDELQKSDPFGERTQDILLYGHVIAHAIEPATDYSMPHGEAVSLGLLVELAFYHQPASEVFSRVRNLLDKLGLPTLSPRNLTTENIMAQLAHVMTRGGTLLIPSVGEIGELQAVNGRYSGEFVPEQIRSALSIIAQ